MWQYKNFFLYIPGQRTVIWNNVLLSLKIVAQISTFENTTSYICSSIKKWISYKHAQLESNIFHYFNYFI